MLTVAAALDDLAAALARVLPLQIASAAGDDGAVPRHGLPDPSHVGTVPLISACLLLHLGGRPDAGRLERARRAAAFLRRAQRPSGRIDLIDCNHDSGPDTAFAVQALGAAVLLAERLAPGDAALAPLIGELRAFLRAALIGIADGGFHTPNHRWVVASALALGLRLHGDLPLRATLDALMAEGPDIDDEGCFIERSVGVYDAVCDRALLLIDELVGWPAGRAAALANLRFDRGLLHGDLSAETGLSHRQDAGQRLVPSALVHAMLYAARRSGDPSHAAGAAELWRARREPPLSDCCWLAWTLLAHGPLATPPPDGVLTAYFPRNRLWRHRRGGLSASAFGGGTRLLGLRCGGAELVALSVAQCWHGHGRFVAETMEPIADGVVLRSPGRVPGRRLGYSLPLGRPVPADGWDAAMAERAYRPMPPCAATLAVRAVADGLDLHLRSDYGVAGVAGQIACDFAPGGTWDSAGGALQPQPGQVLFLTGGEGAMRYGADAIAVGPGSDAHRMWAMRDTDGPGGLVRVVIGFRSPVDTVLRLRGRGG